MWFPEKIVLNVFLAVLLFNVSVFAESAIPPKKVLVVYAYEQDRPANILIDQNLRKTFHADELRLKQVLVNLLTNAVKFTPEGELSG